MPELPEVQCVIQSINDIVKQKKVVSITRLTYNLREPLTDELVHSAPFSIEDIERQGKYIILHTEHSFSLIIHLGMTGSLLIRNKQTLREKHDHLILHFETFDMIYNDVRKFGFISIESDLKNNKYLKKLGVDPLKDNFENGNFLYQKVHKNNRNIKTLLLDQKVIAGLGNIYVIEALFLAQIHPETLSKELSLSQCKSLSHHIVKLLKKSIELGGSTISDFKHGDGKGGKFQSQFNIYGKSICPCCQSKIFVIKQNGRSTYLCQKCQN